MRGREAEGKKRERLRGRARTREKGWDKINKRQGRRRVKEGRKKGRQRQ